MGSPLIALHGFLGEPSDWDAVVQAGVPDLIAPDYTRTPLLDPRVVPIEKWAGNFQLWLNELGLSVPPTLIGYSQGGRLALQAYLEWPERFSGLVLLSANPGLPEDDLRARDLRRNSDESWALRFENEPWDEVVEDWNAQPVFRKGRMEPKRSERPDSREIAAASLRSWSLSRQRDARERLGVKHGRVVFVVGECDEKYVALAKGLTTILGESSIHVIPGAGHRLLIDAPEAVAGLVLRGSIFENLR